ncbi:MAG: hypothetical protein R6X16_04285 [Anaerolineae bacterium]
MALGYKMERRHLTILGTGWPEPWRAMASRYAAIRAAVSFNMTGIRGDTNLKYYSKGDRFSEET